VTEADVILFAGISGDFNPLHVDEEFAKDTLFGRRLVHGCFSNALISAVLGTKLPGSGALYASQKTRYVKPVFIGDTLTAVAEVLEKFTKKNGELRFVRLRTDVLNQDDETVTEGEALLIIM